jgi:elongation factor Ts
MVKELRERTGAGMMECKKALVETDGDIDAAIENMRKSGQAKADKKAGRVAAEGLIAIELSADATRASMVEINCETDFVAKEDEFKSFVAAVVKRALEEKVNDSEALGGLTLAKSGGLSIDERRRELVARIGENITLRRVRSVDAAGDRFGAYVHGGRIGVLVDMKGGDESTARDLAMHVAASRPLALSETDIPAEHLQKEREILKAQVAGSGKPPEIQEKMIGGRLNKYLKEVTLLGQPFVKDPDTSVEKYLKSVGAQVLAFTRFEVGEGIEKKSENFAEEVMAQVRGS